MTKNLDTPVLDMEGEPLRESHKGAIRETTVKNYITNALAMANGEQVSGEEKVTRYKLAMRLIEGGEQELSPEELSLIKRVVNMYPPLILGQVYAWADK